MIQGVIVVLLRVGGMNSLEVCFSQPMSQLVSCWCPCTFFFLKKKRYDLVIYLFSGGKFAIMPHIGHTLIPVLLNRAPLSVDKINPISVPFANHPSSSVS